MTSAPTAAATTTARPARGRRGLDGWALAAVPGVLFLLGLFAYPIVRVLLRSVEGGTGNYVRLAESTGFGKILVQTFWIAALVTVVCLLLAYPYALVMSRVGGLWQTVLIILVLVPVWTAFLVRSIGMQVLLMDTGVINRTLMSLGAISEPLPLIRNTFAVTFGMTQILLPFMILPIYSVMRRVRPELVPAALSLGAPPWRAFLQVYVPQTLSGVVSGVLLVFVLSLGFFVVPAILGGTGGTMIARSIVELANRNDLGMASTLAVALLATTTIVLAVGSRFVRLNDVIGGRR
ncbi:MAG: Spermidine Putrescine ABC transporter permease component PotB [uncultured Nocardioidaceae bacterium]|uniref:Spermidine Putrescine ABC transporter permease component PotB n=1 Tax=uncultured Nocardioidaceae bacterium TaxID=253824 RepID=A0A6J4MG73_9ACTN|nr:MAG: Spermidine Putrescine ABC transporter permease component PotB [uncultured Nocardioidaceae bacterium]